MKERIERYMRNQLVTPEIQNTEKSISNPGNTEYKSSCLEVFFNKWFCRLEAPGNYFCKYRQYCTQSILGYKSLTQFLKMT